MTIVKVDDDYKYDTDDIFEPDDDDFDSFADYVLMFWSEYNIPTKEEIITAAKKYIKKCNGVIFELTTTEREAVTMMIDERRKRKFRKKSYDERKIIYNTHKFVNGYCENCGLTDQIKIHRELHNYKMFYTCNEEIIKNIIE